SRLRRGGHDRGHRRAAAAAALRSLLAAHPGGGRADEPLGAARQRLALELERGFRRSGDRLARSSGAALPACCLAQSRAAGVVVRHGGGDQAGVSHVPPLTGRAARGGPALDAKGVTASNPPRSREGARRFVLAVAEPPPRWPGHDQPKNFAVFAASRWKLQWRNLAEAFAG